jgi:hypothetical protein
VNLQAHHCKETVLTMIIITISTDGEEWQPTTTEQFKEMLADESKDCLVRLEETGEHGLSSLFTSVRKIREKKFPKSFAGLVTRACQ